MPDSFIVPMSSPDVTALERNAINEVLDTAYLSIGPKTEAFEKACAAFIGVNHAVSVNSGTAGLHLTIIAAGIGEGDLVLTSSFSFVASANCVLYERAIPVFVDVDPSTGNIDPALVEEAVHDLIEPDARSSHWLPPALRGGSESVRLKAILPIHAFGQPAAMDPINATAKGCSLRVIEDACEALGSEYRGRPAGTLGDAAVFAFYPNKQITTGEGGMIVTDHDDWDTVFRSLRNQGRDVFDAWLNHTRLGYNYRIDELSAALGVAQLQRIQELIGKRTRVAAWYDERLRHFDWVQTPCLGQDTTKISWFVYVIRIRPPFRRNEIIRELASRGIPSRPYFTPIHLQPFYRQRFGYQMGDLPVTEHLGEVSLALPFSSVMTEEQVDKVCAELAACARAVVQAP